MQYLLYCPVLVVFTLYWLLYRLHVGSVCTDDNDVFTMIWSSLLYSPVGSFSLFVHLLRLCSLDGMWDQCVLWLVNTAFWYTVLSGVIVCCFLFSDLALLTACWTSMCCSWLIQRFWYTVLSWVIVFCYCFLT